MRQNASRTVIAVYFLEMAVTCIYLFWWKKNDISEPIEDSDAKNTKKIKKICRFSYVFKKLWYTKLFNKQ